MQVFAVKINLFIRCTYPYKRKVFELHGYKFDNINLCVILLLQFKMFYSMIGN